MEYRNIVSILVIVFYVFSLIASIRLIQRHGFRASYETWFVLATFSASRIAYAALQLSTIAQPDRPGLRIAAGTFAVDGLSPLFFASLGLLHRFICDAGQVRHNIYLIRRHLRLLEVIVTAAFICASIGYAEIPDDAVMSGELSYPPVARAAAIMYIISFSGILLGTAIMYVYRLDVEKGERRVLRALVASQPLLLIRTLYLVLDILGNIKAFNVVSGDETAFLLMALLEEAVVVVLYLGIGYTLRVIPVVKQSQAARHERK